MFDLIFSLPAPFLFRSFEQNYHCSYFDLIFTAPATTLRKKGLSVVGYYHASASMDQVGVNPLARRIADRIHETVKDVDKAAESCLMLVDNQELEQLALALASRRGDLDECGRLSPLPLALRKLCMQTNRTTYKNLPL